MSSTPASPIAWVQRYALPLFLVLTFGLFWLAAPLATVSPVLPGLVAALAPTLAAVVLTALGEGGRGVRALLGKLVAWRVGWPWYLAALGLPLGLSAAIWLVGGLLGGTAAAPAAAVLALAPLIFILAATEEVGWRGYVLPRLLARLPSLAVALLLGALHALYHLPLWVAPGFPPPSYSFLSFFVTSLAFGLLWVWFYLRTGGSVLIAALFHGAINTGGNLFFAGLSPALLSWLLPLGYGLAALVVLAAAFRRPRPAAAPKPA